jgi:hypothetical protein
VKLTSYTYPWDIARLGVRATMARMADHGLEAIDLAAAYHPIDALSPIDGAHLFSEGRGAVYFPVRLERYGRIKPQLHSPEVSRAWPDAASAAMGLGLDLNAWIVTLFQPWIRDAYPDCSRILPSGDRSGSDVCSSHADVREYISHLSTDVAEQFGVGLVRLEGLMPHLYDLNWLRPRIMAEMTPLARTLLNLCFCNSCVSTAEAAGLDVHHIRCVVNEVIAAEIEQGGGDAGIDRAAELAANAAVCAFASLHVRSAIDLIGAVSEGLKGRAKISANASTPYGALIGAKAENELLAQFILLEDQIAMHPANPAGNARVAALNAKHASPRDISMLLARIRGPGAPGSASGDSAQQMEHDLQEAAARGASEITLYTYGLLRDSDVSAFVGRVRKHFGGANGQ